MKLPIFRKIALLALGVLSIQPSTTMESNSEKANLPGSMGLNSPSKMHALEDGCKKRALALVKIVQVAEDSYRGSEGKIVRHIKYRDFQLKAREEKIRADFNERLVEIILMLYPSKNPITFYKAFSFEVRKALWLLEKNSLSRTKDLYTKKLETKLFYDHKLLALEAERDKARAEYQSFYGETEKAQLRTWFFTLSFEISKFLNPGFAVMEVECLKKFVNESVNAITKNNYATEEDKKFAEEVSSYINQYDI